MEEGARLASFVCTALIVTTCFGWTLIGWRGQRRIRDLQREWQEKN